MGNLGDRLRQRIRAQGPLRFDVFQEAALYDPDGGYYERPGRVGRQGDFVTGASWDPAFGRCVARAAKRLRDEWRGVEPVDVVDVGAGEGELLADVDAALRAWDLRDGFRLTGVERSERRRETARERCPTAAWLSSIEELPGLRGLVIAYELFDALPVRALFFDGERLLERGVTLGPGGEGFAWDVAECADGAVLLERFRRRGIHLRSRRYRAWQNRDGE